MSLPLRPLGQSGFQAQEPTARFQGARRLAVVRGELFSDAQGVDLLASTVAEHVAALIRQDRIREAQSVLRAARSAGLVGSRLDVFEKLFEVVARPRETSNQGRPTPGRFDPTQYRGQWVALVGTTVIASAASLKEITPRVRDNEEAVLHWVAP